MSCSPQSCWRSCVTGGEWTSPRVALPWRSSRQTHRKAYRRARRARRRIDFAAFPNRSHRIPCGMHLPHICSNPAPTCAPSNCCWVIVAWLPRPTICASPRPRCAPLLAPSICSRTRLATEPKPAQYRFTSSALGHGSPPVRSGGRVPLLRRRLSSASWRFDVKRRSTAS